MERPTKQQSKSPAHSQARPYPYRILPVTCPDAATIKKLDPWYVLEFFRIEALLRSKPVMDLYQNTFQSWKKGDHSTDTLMATFRVVGGWQVLEGVHHSFYLYQDHPELLAMEAEWEREEYVGYDPKKRWPAPGIVNLGYIIEHEYEHFKVNILEVYKDPQKHRLPRKPRGIWLALDPARSPASLMKGLRSILHKEHQRYKRSKGKIEDPFLEVPWPWPTDWNPYRDPRRPPPIYGFKGIQTWLNYLKCYDLRFCQGLTFGQIGQQVYGQGSRQTYERAEQGYKRAKRLISAAEANRWPPTNL